METNGDRYQIFDNDDDDNDGKKGNENLLENYRSLKMVEISITN